ncbi:protein N-terminal asparagine amidohydrolase isoform X2 [Mauremys reevesii]|uniref:protein N-terminal asparagine amidohydrolase isoform X2 n=1 Tax=Mauremys reevesii TaxID=260615 RepID=UPI001940051B|nr:protein N-terminal asparagine amidohydrolase isoform X2 [Mauremys reevesii]
MRRGKICMFEVRFAGSCADTPAACTEVLKSKPGFCIRTTSPRTPCDVGPCRLPSQLAAIGSSPSSSPRSGRFPEMPLLINGDRIDLAQPPGEVIRTYPQLEEKARVLRGQPAQTVGPKGLLYIQQREFAVTTPKDGSVSILGSDDATTCHLVVLRHTGSGATCLTHCDGSNTRAEVSLIMSAVKSFSNDTECGRLEVHLVGGFNDDRQLSQKLTNQLLRTFDLQQDDVHLVTFCVTELNDREEKDNHFPIIYGIAVNVKTAEIFHATFPDKGPDKDLRSARMLTGAPMTNIYDAKTEQLHIGPYFWMPFPHVDLWLEQDDKQILQNLSTSPLAEPPHFVSHLRSTLLFLKEHPFPAASLFPNRKPRLYKKTEEGLWERVCFETI